MADNASTEITALLQAWSGGDARALDRVTSLVAGELRRIARRSLQHNFADPILDTTALINEAYVRLIDGQSATWQNRAHFFAVCAQIMRHILVDNARALRTAKRGGGRPLLPLHEALAVAPRRMTDLVEIDDALQALARVDSRKSKVVELRFFGGLTVEEVAEVLKVSQETVRRDWRLAKAWLMRELGGAAGDDTSAMAAD
jgi:RNA polymerase sigma factor (TIGR02999 family)